MKSVRFLKAYKVYNVGETAGFPSAEANRLIDIGTAEDPSAPKPDVKESKPQGTKESKPERTK